MKGIFLIVLGVAFTSTSLSAQTSKDNKRIVKAFNKIVTAAATQDYSRLKNLCDPTGENDGDTECICALFEGYKTERCGMEKEELIRQFRLIMTTAKQIGQVVFVNESAAVLHFNMGPDHRRQEQLNFVKRKNKWYLSSF